MCDSWTNGPSVAEKIIEMHSIAIKIALNRMIEDGTLTEYINKSLKESYIEEKED